VVSSSEQQILSQASSKGLSQVLINGISCIVPKVNKIVYVEVAVVTVSYKVPGLLRREGHIGSLF
jgi:hypothetical protein